MGFKSAQIALNAATATALWQVGGTAPPPTLTSSGSIQDPVPVVFICGTSCYLGPSGVTSANGFLLPANTPFPISFFGSSEILYALASASTPTAYLIFGRQ